MNKQTTAIVLCALLLSTFAHEHQSRAHLFKQVKSHGPSKLLSRDLQYRDESEGQCGWVCPGTPPSTGNSTGNSTDVTIGGDIKLIINATAGIIAKVNVTAQVALAIDIQANITVVFNGRTGAAVIIDLGNNSGIYIPAGACQDVWISSHESFETYINTLVSLKVILEIGLKVGKPFDVNSPTDEVLEIVAGVLIHLSADIALQLKVSIKAAVSILIELSVKVTGLLNGVLKGLLDLVGSVVLAIQGDIKFVVAVLGGLGDLLGRIQGGIDLLIKNSIKLDLKIIFGAKSGIEVLVYILTTLSAKVDIGVVLGSVLNSPEVLLGVIVKLGGNISVGLNGLFKVIAQLIALVKTKITINVFIGTLIRYCISASTGASISQQFSSSIQALLEITSKSNSSSSLSACIKFLTEIRDNKLVINGVNISAVIAVLLQIGGIVALDLVIRVLLLLKVVVAVEMAISQLLLTILGLLNTAIGIHLVLKLIPNIKIDVNIDTVSGSNILSIILKGINIRAIIRAILRGNIIVILPSLPVIGNIYTAISASLKTNSNNTVELSTCLKASASVSIVAQIKAILLAALHIHVGGQVTVGQSTEEDKGHHTNKERHHLPKDKLYHHEIGEKHDHDRV